MLQVFINCLIFVDLYLTLRNPFFPRKRRMFFYYLSASIIFTLILFFISMDLRSLQPDQLEGEMMKGHNTAQMVMFGYTVTLILFTVIPTFLVIRRLLRKGTSRQLKRKVVQRHLFFFLIYCIALIQMVDIQTEFIENWLYKVVEENPEFESKAMILSRSKEFVFDSVGIALALCRITEPFFWKHLIFDLKCVLRKIFCFCISQKRRSSVKKVKFSDEPLCAFATSAMNIEFVYLILLGVNNFMNNQQLQNDDEEQELHRKVPRDNSRI